MGKVKKFKKGAASFYIVAMSTLILVIIAASFAAVIISEVTRTSNDDLAQSAYDSALAGIEDAKLAYYNYQNCKIDVDSMGHDESGKAFCADLIDWVENDTGECDMVADTLGRSHDDKGVLVQESDVNNNMQQYYTCVKMTSKTEDVKFSTDSSYTVRLKFDEVDARDIKTVRISWHLEEDGESDEFKYEDFSGNGIFGDQAVMPAVVAVSMVQTSEQFNLNDFDVRQGSQTDRGTVYLVPTDQDNLSASGDKYNFSWDGGRNLISTEGFSKSNDKTVKNLPYVVYCNNDNDGFACSTDLEIPDPIGGNRSNDTFMFMITLPYGGPYTHFSLEFFCGDGVICSKEITDEGEERYSSNKAILNGVQLKIDSTGRANDLYRRVETRLEAGDTAYPYPIYAIQAFGDGSDNSPAIWKDLYTTCEYNFGSPTC